MCISKGGIEFQYISCYCLSYPNAPATGATYYFNTSHVTVYPIIQPVFWYHFLISIHLMLLFIILSNTVYHILSIISIHLMLLFIKMIRLERANVMHFNTSHVTVYQKALFGISQPSNISIHLMLLFIFLIRTPHTFIANFNTSHVTVYHYPGFFCSALRKFQYISCYCLSDCMTKVGFWKEFQYISCYCLSSYSRRPVRLACDFNTSHVTVYPRTTHLPNSGYHFNTSHVTVYRSAG